jgi:hypothetical protein
MYYAEVRLVFEFLDTVMFYLIGQQAVEKLLHAGQLRLRLGLRLLDRRAGVNFINQLPP